MAALTGSFPFKLFLRQPKSTPALSSFESKLFGVRLSKPGFAGITFFVASQGTVTARYGGGSRSSGGGNFRRPRESDYDDDSALDLSSVRSATVRLIDENQNMVGIMPKIDAIRMAEDAELDLVILSPDADPPVVKIMDYNKFRYEQQKKKREQQKKSLASRSDLKELKMGYNIDQHDYSVRLKSARKFLKEGDKVKVMVNLKGRQNEFRNIAIELIKRFQNDVGELATEESKNFSDRNIFIVLGPNKAVLQKAQDAPKKKEKSSADEVSAGTGGA